MSSSISPWAGMCARTRASIVPGPKRDLDLTRLDLERPARHPPLAKAVRDVGRPAQRRLEAVGRPPAVQDRLGLGVGERVVASDQRAVHRDLAVRAEREADGEPVGSRPAGCSGRTRARPEASGRPAREVDGSGPPGGLGVQAGSRGHVRRDVGDVHVHAVAVDGERVVVVLRALRIDREGREAAQVEAVAGAAASRGATAAPAGHGSAAPASTASACMTAAGSSGLSEDLVEPPAPAAVRHAPRRDPRPPRRPPPRCPRVTAGPGSKYGSATTTRARVDTSPTMRAGRGSVKRASAPGAPCGETPTSGARRSGRARRGRSRGRRRARARRAGIAPPSA